MTAECRIKQIGFIYRSLEINLQNASFGLCFTHCTELLLPTLALCLLAEGGNVWARGHHPISVAHKDVCRSGDTSRGSFHLSTRTKSPASTGTHTGATGLQYGSLLRYCGYDVIPLGNRVNSE